MPFTTMPVENMENADPRPAYLPEEGSNNVTFHFLPVNEDSNSNSQTHSGGKPIDDDIPSPDQKQIQTVYSLIVHPQLLSLIIWEGEDD